jgi:4,5-epoxidase
MGGQGLNTGIQDGYNLGWKLAAVAKGIATPRLLDTYEEERLPVARSVLRWTRVLTKMLEAASPGGRFLRDEVFVRAAKIAPVRRWFLTTLSQVKISYGRSSISYSFGRFNRKAPKAGDRAPDALCLDYPSLGASSLFDAMRGITWHMLLFQGRAPGARDWSSLGELASRLDASSAGQMRVHLVVTDKEIAKATGWGGSILLDSQGELHSTYSATRPCMYLIRPDGYVGLRCCIADEAKFVKYFGQVLDGLGSRLAESSR